MKYSKHFNILEKLQFLADNKIKMHTQIVLVPGWNDRQELQRTVFDLAKFFPQIESIAIVPVGLTKYRQTLTPISLVDKDISSQLIEHTNKWRQIFKQRYNKAFLYLADEIFLLAKHPVPKYDYYEEFSQLENGIGMVRQLLDKWKVLKKIKNSYKRKYTGKYV